MNRIDFINKVTLASFAFYTLQSCELRLTKPKYKSPKSK